MFAALCNDSKRLRWKLLRLVLEYKPHALAHEHISWTIKPSDWWHSGPCLKAMRWMPKWSIERSWGKWHPSRWRSKFYSAFIFGVFGMVWRYDPDFTVELLRTRDVASERWDIDVINFTGDISWKIPRGKVEFFRCYSVIEIILYVSKNFSCGVVWADRSIVKSLLELKRAFQ